MKKIFASIIFFLSLFSFMPAMAQFGPGREVHQWISMQYRMLEGIPLSTAQHKKVDKLIQKRGSEIAKVKNQSQNRYAKINAEFDKDLRKILSPAQMALYQSNRARFRNSSVAAPGKNVNNSGGIGQPQQGPRPGILTHFEIVLHK